MDWLKKTIEFIRGKLEVPNKKRRLENYVLVIVMGIVLIVIGNSLFGGSNSKESKSKQSESIVQPAGKSHINETQDELTSRVESILSKIEGAGRVSVLITYISGKEMVPAYDTKKNENNTQEKDSGGGTRNIRLNDSESSIAYEESQGQGKKPVVLKEIQPAVKGVVVVADGAMDIKVKESLSRAIQVLLDVPLHKIQVLERSR